MAFKSNDRTFEKVYGIFDKRDYFNAKGLAKVQIGNFERALQKNDKGAQQILDKFNGDMDKAKEYIIQVITDRKKEEAFNQYKAFKAAVDSIQKGNPIHGAVDLVKSRIHNNSQKYTMALYSTLRNQKFNKWKDVHADVDSLIGESVNEVGVNVWYFYKKANKNKNKFFEMLSDLRKKHSDTAWIKMLNYALEDFNENPKKYKTIDDKQNILFKNLQNNKKVKGIDESVNEAKYTVIDPRGNSLGTADKTQVFMAAKKKGGEKTGHFVVSAKNALKARRTLEKFKGDFKNPKLKDIMAGLYESIKYGRGKAHAVRDKFGRPFLLIVGEEPKDSKGKSEYKQNGFYISPQKGFKGLITAYFKDEKTLRKNIDKKYHDQLDESVNEAKTYTPKQVKQALEKMVKQLKAKWKQKGGYENFGQRELRKFKDTFGYSPYGSSDEREISDLIDSFEDWAMDYSG